MTEIRPLGSKVMKKKTFIILTITHIVAVTFGFAAGIYALPILIAPPAPSVIEVQAASAQPAYSAVFIQILKAVMLFTGVRVG